MLIVLTGTAIIVGAALAGFFQLVYPRIEANRIAEEKRAIFSVLTKARDYEIIEKEITGKKGPEVLRIFKGKDGVGTTVGYAFVAKGPGFQGIVSMMVGLNIDMATLSGMKVLDQVETPGLGNKIVEDKFQNQFKGLAIKPKITYIKNKKPEDPNQIQAITGATISSAAVADIINKRIVVVLSELEADGIAAVPEESEKKVHKEEGEE